MSVRLDHGEDTLNEIREAQPTLGELNSEFNQNLWMCIISGIFCFFPWLVLPFLIPPHVRMRKHLRQTPHHRVLLKTDHLAEIGRHGASFRFPLGDAIGKAANIGSDLANCSPHGGQRIQTGSGCKR